MKTLLSFLCGAAAAGVLALVFSFKPSRPVRIIARIAAGFAVTALLSLTGALPFNALNGAMCGVLGAPGLVASMIIVRFL